MAKTLIYAAGSPRQVKIGDTDTVLYLQIAKDNVSVDLTKVQAIQVKIADKESFLKTITIDKSKLAYDPTNGVVELPMSKDNIGGLPTNTYQFEVWITTADSENEIYPDVGVAVFSIINNIEGGSVVYTSLTLQDFYNAFSDLAITAKNDHNTAVADSAAVQQNTQTANTAAENAQQVLNTLSNGEYLKRDDYFSNLLKNPSLWQNSGSGWNFDSSKFTVDENIDNQGIKGFHFSASGISDTSFNALTQKIAIRGTKFSTGCFLAESLNNPANFHIVLDFRDANNNQLLLKYTDYINTGTDKEVNIISDIPPNSKYVFVNFEFKGNGEAWIYAFMSNYGDVTAPVIDNSPDMILMNEIKANDSAVMHNTGDETATGQKTFINGNFGIRIAATGIQKTTDGGQTWAAATL
ncbi:hypothetical protein [Oenococcus sicerae]|uniref:hypothetical protein n=1 Tax=Oenococcus sicerae TaxID=2203724 RepID=UPI0039E9112C